MNLFGMKSGGMKRNPLAGLMQPNLAEMLQPEGGPDEMPPSQPQVYNPARMANPFAPGANMPAPPDPAQNKGAAPSGGGFKEFMTTPLWGDNSMLMTKPEQGRLYDFMTKNRWFLPPTEEGPGKMTGYVPGSGQEPTVLPKSMAPAEPMWTPPGTAPTGKPPEPSSAEASMDSLMNGQKNLDTAMGGGLFGSAIAATQDLLRKHAQTAQTLEGAKAALKHEFQDTPELDQIIAATQNELAQTKANRKQPGIGEFLTMALLNLSGMNPRQSADMVLGLSNQEGKENRLEDRLAQLEGGRATAKMHGRQEFRANEKQEKYQALQNMFRQQEMGRKQGNEDREFGFKNQKLGVDKLMQELGQIRQQMQFETDPARRKKMQEDIDRLDPYGNLQQKMRQQQQTPIKDDRQSRMFGDLLGGGGYA